MLPISNEPWGDLMTEKKANQCPRCGTETAGTYTIQWDNWPATSLPCESVEVCFATLLKRIRTLENRLNNFRP